MALRCWGRASPSELLRPLWGVLRCLVKPCLLGLLACAAVLIAYAELVSVRAACADLLLRGLSTGCSSRQGAITAASYECAHAHQDDEPPVAELLCRATTCCTPESKPCW